MTPTTPSPISDQAAGEPIAYVNQADLDLLANYGSSGACVLYNRPVGNATIPLFSRSTAPTTGSAPVAVKAFGTGAQVVIEGTFDGKHAVLICPAKQPGEVGASAKREGPLTDDSLIDAVVLTFPTAEQVERVANALVAASPAASVLTDEQISAIVDEFDACHWVDGECRIEGRDMMKLCRALLAASISGDRK